MAKTLVELWQDMDDARRASAALKAARIGSNVAMQADAAVRGAANAMTSGLADNLAAYANTAFGGGSDYRTNLAREAERTAYDHENRRTAQTLGQVGGTALSLAAAAPVKGLSAATRMAGVAPITAREGASALGAGAAVGVGTQGAGDAVTGGRSTAGDYLGAAAGGALGVAALPLGVRSAGAISGAATSGVQDLLNGRGVSIAGLQQGALAGGVLAGVGARVGGLGSQALSPRAKGVLGETMGQAKSFADWRSRELLSKMRKPIPGDSQGRYMYPDGLRGSVVYEDKFGPSARLSRNQTLMRAAIGDDFHLNHFLPRDVGAVASVPGASTGAQIADRQWYRR